MKALVIIILILAVVFVAFENPTLLGSADGSTVVCPTCDGSTYCHVCDGAGANSYGGRPARTCTICDGNGICIDCGGKGSVAQSQVASINSRYGGQADTSTRPACDTCYGSGRSNMRCSSCNGSGTDSAYRLTEGSALHAFADPSCPKCGGSGYAACFTCHGSGHN